MNTGFTVKRRGLAFFRGNTIDLYEPTVPRIVTVQIPNEILSDMEILNQEAMNSFISNILSANKFPPTQFCLILSSPVFTREFQIEKETDLQKRIDVFLEHVPFESVLSKQIPLPNGILVVAANGTLFDMLQKAFMAAHSTIGSITPLLALDPAIQKETALTQPLAHRLLTETQTVQHNAFSAVSQKTNLEYELEPMSDEKQKPKSTLPLLIPVFIVLMVILILVILQSTKPPNSTTTGSPKIQPTSQQPLIK